ncbi:hypothetical protein QBC45DRAFT_175048 [Copromyces sp. CBS 386.78]|nr:hypothetical protein QBC45DRAFT_175048 [Copromyces sp. CBS 386.78]
MIDQWMISWGFSDIRESRLCQQNAMPGANRGEYGTGAMAASAGPAVDDHQGAWRRKSLEGGDSSISQKGIGISRASPLCELATANVAAVLAFVTRTRSPRRPASTQAPTPPGFRGQHAGLSLARLAEDKAWKPEKKGQHKEKTGPKSRARSSGLTGLPRRGVRAWASEAAAAVGCCGCCGESWGTMFIFPVPTPHPLGTPCTPRQTTACEHPLVSARGPTDDYRVPFPIFPSPSSFPQSHPAFRRTTMQHRAPRPHGRIRTKRSGQSDAASAFSFTEHSVVQPSGCHHTSNCSDAVVCPPSALPCFTGCVWSQEVSNLTNTGSACRTSWEIPRPPAWAKQPIAANRFISTLDVRMPLRFRGSTRPPIMVLANSRNPSRVSVLRMCCDA